MYVDYDVTEITIYMDNGHEYRFDDHHEKWENLKEFLSSLYYENARYFDFSWDVSGSRISIVGNHITDVRMKR